MKKTLKILITLVFAVYASGLTGLVHEITEHGCVCSHSTSCTDHIELHAQPEHSHHHCPDHDSANCSICQTMAISKQFAVGDSPVLVRLAELNYDYTPVSQNILISHSLSAFASRAPPAVLL